ncbi:MAG: hypothetical protein RLZZ158_33 [Cyanobacteriota bacterium]|jgi:hypothetical protein
MADQDSSSSILLSALTGAAIGAAGLTWWLLSRAERRQALGQQVRRLRALPPTGGGASNSLAHSQESLEERVQRLNLAIDDVRRQLENLSPDSPQSM